MAPALDSPQTLVPLPAKVGINATPKLSEADKTSGQLDPQYDLLRPYEAFPYHIDAPTVWKAEDYAHNPERWTHHLNDEEVSELSAAADAFFESGENIVHISKETFQLPTMSKFLSAMRTELLNGKGFILFKGFPVGAWGARKSAIAYIGLGLHLGHLLSQNGLGHVLGHVKDVGGDVTRLDSTRIYRTTARQFFHADEGDIVGLLCLARAHQGGESDIVSSHHVFNYLQQHHPDVTRTLCEPIWYFDRKGEVSLGQKPYTRQPVFYIEPGESGRVYTKFDPYHVRSLQRFSDLGIIPPLSAAQEKAITVLEETCQRLALHMILEVGDIQFVSNSHVLHARTAYVDHAPPAPRRHLMRLWLSTPEGEGGWKLPFADSMHKRRGGIQVDDVPPVAPLDAE
ncbi:Clavaminate synthase-like protein [Polychaeton citri CBS 116435]|uniref:Clavaminate synthase-like protein n=1 Tax=Polychaeton citri CBS 116435 TaxID=1314669 RepID=A0A9P4PZC3_9PEZI|nr:Clavaminate synthase-like protein [Polychaeton citri CBS 116435]